MTGRARGGSGSASTVGPLACSCENVYNFWTRAALFQSSIFLSNELLNWTKVTLKLSQSG